MCFISRKVFLVYKSHLECYLEMSYPSPEHSKRGDWYLGLVHRRTEIIDDVQTMFETCADILLREVVCIYVQSDLSITRFLGNQILRPKTAL